jgi:hypothetical protein
MYLRSDALHSPPFVQNHWVSVLQPSSGILNKNKTQPYGNRIYPSSGERTETPNLLGPLERAKFAFAILYSPRNIIIFIIFFSESLGI